MDSFVRRLVKRLLEEGRPLSRNRHFHTFDTPEGRTALRTARRLRALHRDVLRALEEGGGVQLRSHSQHPKPRTEEVCLLFKVGTHRAFLSLDELQLLREMDAMPEALGAQAARRTG
jgi:hypothetical protein